MIPTLATHCMSSWKFRTTCVSNIVKYLGKTSQHGLEKYLNSHFDFFLTSKDGVKFFCMSNLTVVQQQYNSKAFPIGGRLLPSRTPVTTTVVNITKIYM